jgi:hypothetical protein
MRSQPLTKSLPTPSCKGSNPRTPRPFGMRAQLAPGPCWECVLHTTPLHIMIYKFNTQICTPLKTTDRSTQYEL